jgi:2-dehydropantoate 2-reductase
MGNEAELAQGLDASVVGGTVTYGAILRDPGVVECTGLGAITPGSHEADTARADVVSEAFTTCGLNCTVTDEIERVLWEKLAVNAGINPVTAVARVRTISASVSSR